MSKYPKKGLTGVTPDQLTWLSGSWKGRYGADIVEEHWSNLNGGTLMAMFRWLKENKIWFYEFVTIELVEDTILLRIKHFYPGLIGWEEKDKATEFMIVELHEREAIFLQTNKPGPWMIYRMEDENKLISYFEKEDEQVSPDSIFVYEKQAV